MLWKIFAVRTTALRKVLSCSGKIEGLSDSRREMAISQISTKQRASEEDLPSMGITAANVAVTVVVSAADFRTRKKKNDVHSTGTAYASKRIRFRRDS